MLSYNYCGVLPCNQGTFIVMSSNSNQPKPDSYLRLPQVLARFPVSKSHWWNGVKSGKYPKSYKLSENVTAWLCSDIDQLIEGISKQLSQEANHHAPK
jgi:prophage regulatory protein